MTNSNNVNDEEELLKYFLDSDNEELANIIVDLLKCKQNEGYLELQKQLLKESNKNDEINSVCDKIDDISNKMYEWLIEHQK